MKWKTYCNATRTLYPKLLVQGSRTSSIDQENNRNTSTCCCHQVAQQQEVHHKQAEDYCSNNNSSSQPLQQVGNTPHPSYPPHKHPYSYPIYFQYKHPYVLCARIVNGPTVYSQEGMMIVYVSFNQLCMTNASVKEQRMGKSSSCLFCLMKSYEKEFNSDVQIIIKNEHDMGFYSLHLLTDAFVM